MAKSATLQINILSDASGATRGLGQATSGVEKFERGLDRASVAAGAMLGGLALIGKAVGDSASRLQQSGGAIESVFGAQAAAVDKLAADAATRVGLAQAEYGELATVLASSLKNAGVAGDQLVSTTDSLITRGADLAATFGGTTADAVSAISSLLRGERDPIERYGGAMSQAEVDAQILAMGLDTSTVAAERAANMQATMALLMQRTSAASGQFSRELGSASGAAATGTAAFENTKAALGEALLPALVLVSGALQSVSTWTQNNTGTVQALAIVIGALAAGVLATKAAFEVWTAAQRIATAVQWAYNAAVSANPLTIIIVAVLALIGIIALLVAKFGGIQAVLQATGQVFQTVWSAILGFIQPVIDVVKWLWEKFQDLIDFGARIGSALGGWFSAPAGPRSELNTAPGLYGAGGLRTAGLLTAGGGAALSPGGTASGAGTVVYNVTVNGALDPTAVAAQIESLTTRRDKNLGRRAPLAFGRPL